MIALQASPGAQLLGRWPAGGSEVALALRGYVVEQMCSLQQLQADLDERISQLNELQVTPYAACAATRVCRRRVRMSSGPGHH